MLGVLYDKRKKRINIFKKGMSDNELHRKGFIKCVESATFAAVLALFFMFTGARLAVIYDNIWTTILMIVEAFVLLFYFFDKSKEE